LRQYISTTADDTVSAPLTRPVLAPSTWLVGQLQESALARPPWAVEQPKRGYVEMSELAYRIAEQANGEQTVDEIATAVSTALRRPVSAIDVEALIDTVLIPRGVVQGARGAEDGTVDAPEVPPHPNPFPPRGRGGWAAVGMQGPHGRATPGSSGLRGRVGRAPQRATPEWVVGPQRLEAVASVLMWLFWPPVMLVVVAVGLALLAWLIAIHGLAQSVIHVLAVPVLLPITLAIAALGAAVQGIGPMVALYSGGAAIQRLRISPGPGRPSFGVDMSDDYGLSRWSRLTVNVSGTYLQLAVTLLLCALGLTLGAEFLFLAVALLTLNMLRLLLPFGRPGADRLLADWLLVQRPLHYAERALGRYLPGDADDSASALPPLKRWGWVTIGLYLLAAGVVLVVVGLVILRTVPPLVVTALVALVAYLSGMLAAIGERDVLGFLASLFNATVLALTGFCLLVGLIVAVRSILARAWAWSRETPMRRLLGLIGAAILIVLLLAFWVPVRGFGGDDAPRSLAGVPFRSLGPFSRGTLFDLFAAPAPVDGAADLPGQRPTVTTDIGSGPVGGPLPGQATPATGGVGAGAGSASGTAGSTSGAPADATPAVRAPGLSGEQTPEPRNAGRGTPGTADQRANEPAASGTTPAGSAPSGNAAAARGTADADIAPAGRATAGPDGGPAAQGTAGPNDQSAGNPASKPMAGTAGQPSSKPTGGVVVQPINKPTVGAAAQPGSKPSTGATGTNRRTGAAGQPTNKPSTQATRALLGPNSAQDDDSEDAQDVTPGPASGTP
jgi:putative peptide zinc metalloprotease protein